MPQWRGLIDSCGQFGVQVLLPSAGGSESRATTGAWSSESPVDISSFTGALLSPTSSIHLKRTMEEGTKMEGAADRPEQIVGNEGAKCCLSNLLSWVRRYVCAPLWHSFKARCPWFRNGPHECQLVQRLILKTLLGTWACIFNAAVNCSGTLKKHWDLCTAHVSYI